MKFFLFFRISYAAQMSAKNFSFSIHYTFINLLQLQWLTEKYVSNLFVARLSIMQASSIRYWQLHQKNVTSDAPKFIEVPPHILILSEIEAFIASMWSLQVHLVQNTTGEMDKCRFLSSSCQSEEIIKTMKEHTDKFMTIILTNANSFESVKQQFLCWNSVLESVIEEEDFDEENKSYFEVITNMKKQKITIGLNLGRLNPLHANFKTLVQLVTNRLTGIINDLLHHFNIFAVILSNMTRIQSDNTIVWRFW